MELVSFLFVLSDILYVYIHVYSTMNCLISPVTNDFLNFSVESIFLLDFKKNTLPMISPIMKRTHRVLAMINFLLARLSTPIFSFIAWQCDPWISNETLILMNDKIPSIVVEMGLFITKNKLLNCLLRESFLLISCASSES